MGSDAQCLTIGVRYNSGNDYCYYYYSWSQILLDTMHKVFDQVKGVHRYLSPH